jgi:nitrogen fixation protein NifU and related proteins
VTDALNPAAEFDYSPRVRELFADMRHAGVLAPANAVHSAVAGSREQGASIRLQTELQGNHVQAVRYQAYGCPHFLAACENLAQWVEGRAVDALSQWQWREVEAELQVPVAKRARLLLLDDVLRVIGHRLHTLPGV